MVRQPGAVRMTRGERAPHSGQADGRSLSAIARNCVNGPHFLHIYSYVGIDHLHPGKTHPAADQSVAIMETIPVDSWVVNFIGHFLARGPAAEARQISGADADTSYRRPVRERTGAGRMSACVQVCAPPPRRKAA